MAKKKRKFSTKATKRLAEKKIVSAFKALSKAAFSFKTLPDKTKHKPLVEDEEPIITYSIV